MTRGRSQRLARSERSTGSITLTGRLIHPRPRRAIAIPDFAVEALRHHHRKQTTRKLRAGNAWHDLNLVVELGDGRPVDPSEFSRKFTAIATKAGAKGVRLHDMRHAFATMLLTSGVHPKIASEALGHSTVGITLDTYSHVLPNMQAEAAAAIQEVLGHILDSEPVPPHRTNVRELKPSPRQSEHIATLQLDARRCRLNVGHRKPALDSP